MTEEEEESGRLSDETGGACKDKRGFQVGGVVSSTECNRKDKLTRK